MVERAGVLVKAHDQMRRELSAVFLSRFARRNIRLVKLIAVFGRHDPYRCRKPASRFKALVRRMASYDEAAAC